MYLIGEFNLSKSCAKLKYIPSNSVAFIYNGQVVSIGCGQQNRVDCVKLAGKKARKWLLRQHPKVLDLYKYGNLAYVGCGFSDGVHNILEPALQGCFVSYGPNTSLLDEAIQLDNSQLGKKIYTVKDFLDFLKTNNKPDFLNENKSKVNDLFKINTTDFREIVNIVYEK